MFQRKGIIDLIYIIANVFVVYNWLYLGLSVGDTRNDHPRFWKLISYPAQLITEWGEVFFVVYYFGSDLLLYLLQKRKVMETGKTIWDSIVYNIQVFKYLFFILVLLIILLLFI